MAGTRQLERLKMMVGGLWLDAEDGGVIESVNPYTGRPWALVPNATAGDVDQAVLAARAALDGPWGRTTGPARADLMRALAIAIADGADRLARIESTDNGKLLRETLGVAAQLPRWLNYFAGAAERLTGQTIPTGNPNYFVYTLREPIGVVGAIIPWNAPLILLMMKLAPALAAGCTIVAKPAEQTTASALEVARLVDEVGFPPGVFNVIAGDGAGTGRALVRHPGVDKVMFTGSTRAGIAVMKDAAEHVAPVTLELGGKSPNVVFADADLDAATNGVIASVFAATGQMCIAGGRLIVQRGISDELVARVAARAEAMVLGDPLDEATEMGPLATSDQLDRVLGLIDAARREGASLVAGGDRPTGGSVEDGFFIRPTVVTDVNASMTIAREEVFGPVVAVFPFDSEEEAIAMANDTVYGLAGAVWTTDLQRGHRMAKAIHAGTIWLNSYRVSDPAVPFGGMGMSGFGRENGDEMLNSLTELKSVWVEMTGATRDPLKMG
jgi:acyl-CoA reductase-like NAD-dependent aldehyde dehydrogenase